MGHRFCMHADFGTYNGPSPFFSTLSRNMLSLLLFKLVYCPCIWVRAHLSKGTSGLEKTPQYNFWKKIVWHCKACPFTRVVNFVWSVVCLKNHPDSLTGQNSPNLQQKMGHTMWKGINDCARKWCRKLGEFLFEVAFDFGKDVSGY